MLVRQRGALFEAIIRALKNARIAGRRRRPAGADRAHRGDGPAGAGRRAAAAGRRSRAGDGAQEPAVRLRRTRSCSSSRGTARARCARRCARTQARRSRGARSTRWPTRRAAAHAVRVLCRRCSAPSGGRKAVPGAARAARRTTRSTNSSISRSTTRAARRRRCRASSPGCARPSAEVKRDMEIARDEVRVMTVHGAKGLEAPIVILADTTTPPQAARSTSRGCCSCRRRTPRRARRIASSGRRRKDDDAGPIAARARDARSEAEDEYRRLLYVAMTRAADRLVVCGVDGENKRPEGCWYELVERRARRPHCSEGAGRRSATARCGASARSPDARRRCRRIRRARQLRPRCCRPG